MVGVFRANGGEKAEKSEGKKSKVRQSEKVWEPASQKQLACPVLFLILGTYG